MRLAQTFPLIAANEFRGRGAAVSAKLSRERAASTQRSRYRCGNSVNGVSAQKKLHPKRASSRPDGAEMIKQMVLND